MRAILLILVFALAVYAGPPPGGSGRNIRNDSNFTGNPPPPAPPAGTDIPVIDSITSVTNLAAWSSSGRLFAAYAGNIVEVRRSTDNSTTNIGINSNGWLDTNTLQSWSAGGDVFVRTLYDQASTNHMTNYVTTTQPKIASSGVVIMDGAYPVMDFVDTTQHILRYINYDDAATPLTISTIAAHRAAGQFEVVFFAGDKDQPNFYYSVGTLSGNSDANARGGSSAHATTTLNHTNAVRYMNQGLFTNSTSLACYTNGVWGADQLAASAVSGIDSMAIGGLQDSTPSDFFHGRVDTVILSYGLMSSADMTTLLTRK